MSKRMPIGKRLYKLYKAHSFNIEWYNALPDSDRQQLDDFLALIRNGEGI